MNLLEICELAWRQLYPNPSDETAITKEEFISTGKAEYGTQVWLKARNDKREEGYFDMPSNILVAAELDVKDNVMDISSLKILRSIPDEKWLQNIGGLTCKCSYIKSNVNLSQLLSEDDCMSENDRTYFVIGKEIHFPQGVHISPLKIIYAGIEKIDGKIEIDDMIGGIVRTRLLEIYGGKTGIEDTTNNSTSTA